MLDELRATPEVLYGAAIAFAIVVLLPSGRRDGPAPRCGRPPDSRRLDTARSPQLGGLAIFLGIIVPALAFLDLSGETRGVLLGAAVATVVGAVDDFRGLAPRRSSPGRSRPRRSRRRSASGSTTSFPFLGVLDIPAWIGVPVSILFIVAVA